jgi:two-component system, LytTR family, response regulator
VTSTRPQRRVLVVDDELPARKLLCEYLRAHPEWLVVGEARDGLEAVRLASEHKPDLILLDVQMPKADGFEALGLIEPSTAVIFTTAYDQHALRAFDVHAVDYLLKPFSQARFDEALARASQRIDAAPVASADAASTPSTARFPSRLVVRDGPNLNVVQLSDVDFFQGQDDYVEVFFRGRSCLLSQTLRSLEESLDPTSFVRVHRSYLLNVARLVRLEPLGSSSRVAVLSDGRTLPVSRSGEARLRAHLTSA